MLHVCLFCSPALVTSLRSVQPCLFNRACASWWLLYNWPSACCPAGLVLGCSDESLLSHPLSSFLPLRGKVNTLFLESLSPKEGE
jgi:hypothetical protein